MSPWVSLWKITTASCEREVLSPLRAEAALSMNIQQYSAASLRGSPAAPPSLSPTAADGGLAVSLC